MTKLFTKNDSEFICKHCGKLVPALKYSSRDHCNSCLYSIHIDRTPGDRNNSCLGMMRPINVEYKAGEYAIIYKCEKCGEIHKNKMAKDDNFEEILKIMRENSLR